MSRVYVLVEGQTEQAFIRDILAPTLSPHGIYLSPVLVGEPGHKGGIRRFHVVQRDVSSLLKQDADGYVTTLFDRYGLPHDWPGLDDSKQKATLAQALDALCEAMRDRLNQVMGPDFRAERFMPYIQFHETEAFLFVRPDETARVLGDPKRAEQLLKVVEENGGCEDINDNANTAPSKRIAALFPGYKKGRSVNAHLPRVCMAVGLHALRDACPLFDRWVGKLESLASI
jgi:hypothetical protein